MTSDQYSPYGAGKIAGAMEEQERIIKLLEAQAAVTGYVQIEFLKLYALIKGENK